MSKSSAWHLEEQENPTWGNKTSYKNPVFQKRHFEFIADTVKKFKNEENWIHNFEHPYQYIADIFAKEFTKISPKNNDGKPLFDKDKFLDRINK